MPRSAQLTKPQSGSRIADAIEHAIRTGDLKPGDKLCSESELARKYCGSVYSIRQATRKLKADGILYSVPKSGVFVSRTLRQEKKTGAGNPGSETAADSIRFATRGVWSKHKELYQKIAGTFANASLSRNMNCLYHQAPPSAPFPKADLYEYSNHSSIYQNCETFIDFSRYFTETVRYPDKMKDSFGIPLCCSVPVMLYNRELLEKMGFGSRPDCRNYETMSAFMDEVTADISCRGSLAMPGTNQNIIYKLGHDLEPLFRDIRNNKLSEKHFIDRYYDLFREITAYWKKYHICYPQRTMQHLNDFCSGKTPFFFGLSSNYLKIVCEMPEFPLGAAIMPSHDDTVSAITLLLAVDSESPCLIDSIRLARHFQKAEFQADFARNGYAPMETPDYRFLPFDNAGPAMKIEDYINRENFAVAMNIINVELWNIVLFDKTIEDAIQDILFFSRSLLAMKLDHPAMARQLQWAEIYQ